MHLYKTKLHALVPNVQGFISMVSDKQTMWLTVPILPSAVWWPATWLSNGLVPGGRVGVRFKEDISLFRTGRNLYEICHQNWTKFV